MNRYRLIVNRFSQITQPPVTPGGPIGYTRRRRGDILELDDAEAARLLAAKAVVPFEDEDQADADEQPVGGSDVVTVVDDGGEPDPVTVVEVVDPAPSLPPHDPTDISAGPKGALPPKTAVKAVWVAYAVQNGMSEEVAESMSKDALRAHFGAN